MPIIITMPALSPTMEDGTLVKWLIKEGNKVSPGDIIAEIETDKATMEVEATDEGVLAKILVNEGTEKVKVNAPIGILVDEDENIDEALASISFQSTERKNEKEILSTSSTSENTSLIKEGSDWPSCPSEKQDTSLESERRGRPFSSPLARRLAMEAQLDIAQIQGSGPHGRVIRSDVENWIASGKKSADNPKISALKDRIVHEQAFDLIPHDGMRKTIARRLTEAKSTIPHFYLRQECEIADLLALRKKLNEAAPKNEENERKWKISVNDMIIRALALALRDVPEANVAWSDNNMIVYRHVDIGVAVSVPGGLMTPVIRCAELKSLLTISQEVKDLAARARARKLKPEEYEGGTSSISNLGMLGIDEFSAIINPPQTSILAVGTAREKAIVNKSQITTTHVISVTLSADHRAVDGALAAQLIKAFQNYIENPIGILL